MRHTVELLENLLRSWEDSGFINDIIRKLPSDSAEAVADLLLPEGHPLSRWQELREHLLQAQTGGEFDTARFLGADDLLSAAGTGGSGRNFDKLFPLIAWLWTRHSRRVFQMSADLSTLLRATSFHTDLTAEDVGLPFGSFLITLEEPLRGSFSGDDPCEYAGLLVFTIPAKLVGESCDVLGVHLVPAAAEQYQGINQFDREAIRSALRRSDCAKVARVLSRIDRRDHRCFAGTELILTKTENLARLATVEKALVDKDDDLTADVMRLVLGLSLYLQTLPPGSPHHSDWTPAQKSRRPDPRAITMGAQVCTVASMHALTREEQRTFADASSKKTKTTGCEISVHFRRGHFRRAPGTGDDPNAPKIIWVRPTMVRRDRLGEGELTGGTVAETE